MIREVHERLPLSAAVLALALVISGALAHAQPNVQFLPNMGQQITPLAPQDSRFEPLNPGLTDKPDWLAGQAVTTVVSPDYQSPNYKTLLVLTSGFNRVYNTYPMPVAPYPPDSEEYVFVYNISTPTPFLKQVLKIPNTYSGIVFDPSVTNPAFYVTGGPSDNLHIFTLNAGTWAETGNSPIALGHITGGIGVGVYPCAAGVAISSDGQTLVVVNYYNDSITVFKGGLGNWTAVAPNFDLRPGKNDPSKVGIPGGEYPYWAVVKGAGSSPTAYISSIRDREIDVVSLGAAPAVTARIPVKGQPNKMTLNAAQTLLYVADDQADTVDVIDTVANAILETIPVLGAASGVPSSLAQYKGANPNSVTLSPDETQLYVTNGNLNCIAVVALGGNNSGGQVVGLIPTGWYPNSVSLVSFAGVSNSNTVYAYVVNGKSPTGPNPGWCYGGYGPPGWITCSPTNAYNPQLLKAGFQSFPLPIPAQLAALTAQVATNNRFSSTESPSDAAVMAAVHQAIQHVIFILKENRTYDQILGDLEVGNGDPSLTLFGEAVTPNEHNLARNFVTLDNFLDTAEVSYDGWLWSNSAQAPDVVQKQWPVAYAYRGLSLDSEGLNRNVNVGIPSSYARVAADSLTPSDPDVLPGQTDVDAPDGPDNEVNTGYLWDAALRAHLTVRNYGFFVDITRYGAVPNAIPVERYPAATNTIVAYPTNVALTPLTDMYFRGFDNSLPDYYRFKEWEREFDAMPARRGNPAGASQPAIAKLADAPRVEARQTDGGIAQAPLPALTLVRLMHDHTGNWTTPGPPIDGVNTPELQVADNDYAVGLLIQKIAHSEYANNTLIFVIEDDAQDGGDHVDSHRSIAFVAGPYVKQQALVSTQYNTLNFLRTMEEVLGLPPMNLNDALAAPMADIFNTTDLFVNKTPSPWSFTAVPSAYLYGTSLPLPPKPPGLIVPRSTHNAKYWARVTKGMDFTDADRVDSVLFNRILWKGIMGNKPYPAALAGTNLRQKQAATQKPKTDTD
jgi:YVTN family beta-propeller protein